MWPIQDKKWIFTIPENTPSSVFWSHMAWVLSSIKAHMMSCFFHPSVQPTVTRRRNQNASGERKDWELRVTQEQAGLAGDSNDIIIQNKQHEGVGVLFLLFCPFHTMYFLLSPPHWLKSAFLFSGFGSGSSFSVSAAKTKPALEVTNPMGHSIVIQGTTASRDFRDSAPALT